ncbi:MAG: TM2 domain-containing protein [Alphaproteobacteria bacterium]|jgi:TM2 domain-containing membrane protein YozV
METQIVAVENVSPKNWILCLLLCIFFGVLGFHRFYVGKWGTGLIYLITGGVFSLGVLFDIFLLATKQFTDVDGDVLLPE